MTKVCVVGGGFAYIKMYEEAGFEVVYEPTQADLLQFTGGEDVDPSMYSEKKHPTTGSWLHRDIEEQKIYERAVQRGQSIVGICRGSQFLNVMNGGKLWQNVDKHATYEGHNMICNLTGDVVKVSSTHHQMMRPAKNAIIIGVANEATVKECFPAARKYPLKIDRDSHMFSEDIEVVFYPETKTLCYQPHPEIMGVDSDCRKHFFHVVKELLGCQSQ